MNIKRIYEATSYKKWNDIGYKYEELGEEAEENNKNNEADAYYQFSSICDEMYWILKPKTFHNEISEGEYSEEELFCRFNGEYIEEKFDYVFENPEEHGDEIIEALKSPESYIAFLKKYILDEDIKYLDKAIETAKSLNAEEIRNRIEKVKKSKEKVAKEQSNKQKWLTDAIATTGIETKEINYEAKDDWFIILDTEDEYDAENVRDTIAEALNGEADNAYGASYDDIQGMGNIHLGSVKLYEWSEMCGGDSYDDLDEDIRDKYVIFACSKQKWISYRQQTDW